MTVAQCQASTIVNPLFGQVQNNCDYNNNPPSYGNCEVIGTPDLYDIQAASVTINSSDTLLTVMIYLDSGAVQQGSNNQLVLGPFNDGVWLIPGDIFFYNPNTVYDPSDPATSAYLQYGIPLVKHGSFAAGSLYNITGSPTGTSVETAQQALNNVAGYYRLDEDVLMTGTGTALTSGSVTVASNGGNGTTSALDVVTVTVPITTAFQSVVSNNQVGLLFSSADCGNAYIQGTVGTEAPEPSPALLILSGLGLAAAGCTWRKRAA
jgi:hypothetical protein